MESEEGYAGLSLPLSLHSHLTNISLLRILVREDNLYFNFIIQPQSFPLGYIINIIYYMSQY